MHPALALPALLVLATCSTPRRDDKPPTDGYVFHGPAPLKGQGPALRLAIDARLRTTVNMRRQRETALTTSHGPPLFALQAAGRTWDGFTIDPSRTAVRALRDALGHGKAYDLVARQGPFELALSVAFYERWPQLAVLRARVTNRGQQRVAVQRIVHGRLRLAPATERWAFHGAAVAWARDYVFAVPRPYHSRNYLGPAADQSGGGIPVNYLWQRGSGLALGHLDPRARTLHMPIEVDRRGSATLWLEQHGRTLEPGQALAAAPAFVLAHDGDFYGALATYRALLAAQGLRLPTYPPSAYDPIWCSWGYEFDVRPDELIGILPKLRALGLGWSVLDDRWFVGYGEWRPRPDTFGPRPLKELRRVVDAIHGAGLRAKLWWIPLLVEREGARFKSHVYRTATVAAQHPEWLIRNADGSPARSIRDLNILCPALPQVQRHTRELTERFIRDWGFDGHKLDIVYAVPPCHDRRHGHTSPHDASVAMADIYRIIHDTTRRLKPDSVTEICPCGTTPHHVWIAHMNQAVTADPRGARQVRRRIKLLKALMGPRGAVYADHVELTRIDAEDRQLGQDFAAAIGTGGIIGTKLVWPRPARPLQAGDDLLLTPARERVFRRWIALYRRMQLSSGELLDLYDLAFDRPETHVIRQSGMMHYAFYATPDGASFAGTVELRGLAPGRYAIFDYANDRVVSHVEVGPDRRPPRIPVRFTSSLLVVARPSGPHAERPGHQSSHPR